jgi:hypothetical protein
MLILVTILAFQTSKYLEISTLMTTDKISPQRSQTLSVTRSWPQPSNTISKTQEPTKMIVTIYDLGFGVGIALVIMMVLFSVVRVIFMYKEHNRRQCIAGVGETSSQKLEAKKKFEELDLGLL